MINYIPDTKLTSIPQPGDRSLESFTHWPRYGMDAEAERRGRINAGRRHFRVRSNPCGREN